MKRHLILIGILFFIFGACQHVHYAPKPDNLISEKEMVDVLFDLIKLDATESYNSVQFDRRGVKPRELLFEKYQIDSAQLAESSAYYAEKFAQNERIYDSVRVRLEREKTEVDSLKKEQDSIKKNKALKKKGEGL